MTSHRAPPQDDGLRRFVLPALAFLDLIRGHHVWWWGVLTFMCIGLRGGFSPLFIPLSAGFAMAALSAGGYALNDYFDLEVDRVNAPDRPLPSGRLRPITAPRVSAALFAIGALLSAALGWGCLLVASADIAVLIAYSRTSKRLGWLKTAAVCWLLGSIFVFISFVLRRIDALIVLAGLYAVLCTVYCECVKDLHDLRGDALWEGARTPAMLLEERTLLAVARSALAAAVSLGFVAYGLGVANRWMPVLILAAGSMFFQASRERNPAVSLRWLTAASYAEGLAILFGFR